MHVIWTKENSRQIVDYVTCTSIWQVRDQKEIQAVEAFGNSFLIRNLICASLIITVT